MENLATISESSFKSEIDWLKWNPEIFKNEELLHEYLRIEKTAKENGTWMRSSRNYKIFNGIDEINLKGIKEKITNNEIRTSQLPVAKHLVEELEIAEKNSTIYQGTPEQFVQEHSKNFKNAFSDPDITYRGSFGHITYKSILTQSENSVVGSIFTADKESAIHYGNNIIIEDSLHRGRGLLELLYNKSDNSFEFSANGSGWDGITRSSIPTPHLEKINTLFGDGHYINTNDIAKYLEAGGVNYAKIRNVFDGIEIKEEIIVNHTLGNYLKSRWHNNGMFDMANPDIYK